MKVPSFFSELKRRNVYKVGAAYVVVAWLLIQVATQTFPFFDIPDWAVRLVILLLLLGFPVALVLAWAFELTPQGVKRTDDAAPAAPARPRRRRVWILAAVGLLVAGAAGAAIWHWQLQPRQQNGAETATAGELKSIAVLPFVNISGDASNEYFSDGITEEILNAIAHIPDLRVASRTSAFAYKGRNQDIAEIARNLRVNNVLEGSVQRMGDRVRITAQLVDAKSGYRLWSDRFDRETRDLFAVQDEIAQKIARALRLELTSGGKERAQRSGTTNMESHEAYLRALDAWKSGTMERRQEALRLIDQALALDPNFAAAYALKAETLSSLAFGSADDATYTRYIEMGEAAARRAVELNPQLAEAYVALGEIARRRNDDAVALEHLERAAKLKPADPAIWQSLGLAMVSRDPAQALQYFLKAKELGSANVYVPRQIAYALNAMGRIDEAYAAVRAHHANHPEFVGASLDAGRYELWTRGRPDRALEFFAEAYRKDPTFVDAGVPVSFYPALVFAIAGDMRETNKWLARQTATAADSLAVAVTRLLVAVAEADLEKLAPLAERPRNATAAGRYGRLGLAADAALLARENEKAAELYAELLAPESAAAGATRDTMRRRRNELKLAYVLRKLGRHAEADLLLKETPELFASAARTSGVVWTIQPLDGVFYTDGELYALRGETEKSVQALNATLALPDDGLIPFGSLPVAIEDSPLLESLRGNSRFEAFRQEVARRRGMMRTRVRAASERLNLSDS